MVFFQSNVMATLYESSLAVLIDKVYIDKSPSISHRIEAPPLRLASLATYSIPYIGRDKRRASRGSR